MSKLFVLVAGMPGSGKSVIVDAAKQLQVPVYTMGDVVREETLKRYGTITPDLMIKTSRLLREELGDEAVALKTLEKIHSKCNLVVVIDGVRSLVEVEVFKRHGNVVIVAVHASPKTRFTRLLRRKRPGDPISYEDFVKRDKIELELGLGSVIALADFVIVNEGSIEEARSQAARILAELVRLHGRNSC